MLEAIGGPAKIAVFGLGGAAIFGGAMLLFRRFTEKGGITRAALHKAFQSKKQEEIKEVTKKQEVLNKQLEMAEQASEDSKKRINEIAKKAAVEINQVLKEDSIAKIDEEIDKDWDDL